MEAGTAECYVRAVYVSWRDVAQLLGRSVMKYQLTFKRATHFSKQSIYLTGLGGNYPPPPIADRTSNCSDIFALNCQRALFLLPEVAFVRYTD